MDKPGRPERCATNEDCRGAAPPDDEGDTGDDAARTDARAIALLVHELPEFAPVVAELEDDFGDLPGAHAVFCELAAITSRLLGRDVDEIDEERLERIFSAIEVVARAEDVDVEVAVGFGFLDGLGPSAILSAGSYLGPVTEALYERLGHDRPGDF